MSNQRIIDNISFSATLVATALSVWQDVDETVIALVKGEYYKQIEEILSKLVMQKQKQQKEKVGIQADSEEEDATKAKDKEKDKPSCKQKAGFWARYAFVFLYF